MEKSKLWLSLVALGVAFCLAACNPELTVEEEPTATATATATVTVTPTYRVTDSQNTPTSTSTAPDSHNTPTPVSTPVRTPTSSCPEVDMVYQLDYIHEVVQNMPNVHFEHIAEPDAAFYLTIYEDGTIDSDDFENLVLVSITGTFEDCVLDGNAELSAEIHGRVCRGNCHTAYHRTLGSHVYHSDLSR